MRLPLSVSVPVTLRFADIVTVAPLAIVRFANVSLDETLQSWLNEIVDPFGVKTPPSLQLVTVTAAPAAGIRVPELLTSPIDEPLDGLSVPPLLIVTALAFIAATAVTIVPAEMVTVSVLPGGVVVPQVAAVFQSPVLTLVKDAALAGAAKSVAAKTPAAIMKNGLQSFPRNRECVTRAPSAAAAKCCCPRLRIDEKPIDMDGLRLQQRPEL